MPSASNSVLLRGSSARAGVTLTITATQVSQSIANNTSTISLTYNISVGSSWDVFYTPTNTYMTPTVNGVTGTATKITSDPNISPGQNATVLTTTHTVSHNADGTKTVPISVLYDDRPGGGATTKTVSTFNLTLDTIARASTLSLSSSTQTMGTSYRFTITRASSSFRHKITYAFGSTSGTVLDTTTSDVTTKDWAPPTSLASQSVVTGGNKSATITYYLYTYSGGTQIGSAVSATATLNLPAADTLSSVTASQKMGTAYTFTATQNAANFTHKLNWAFGTQSGTDSTTFTTSKSFTPATSLGSQIPNADSGTISYTITTYNGSTVVGTSAAKTATLSIPNTNGPSFTFSCTPAYGNSINKYVAGFSSVSWSATSVTANYGATIKSYSFTFGGVASTNASGSGVKLSGGSASGTSSTPTMVVTDSRGHSTTKTGTACTIYSYAKPVIISSYAYRTDASGNRKDDGTYVSRLINAKTDYSVGGSNTITVQSRSKTATGSWGSYSNLANNTRNTTGSWAVATAYVVELRVVDTLGGEESVVYTIPTASAALHFKDGGKGAAFFGYAQTDGVLAVNGDITATNYTGKVNGYEIGTDLIYKSVATINQPVANTEWYLKISTPQWSRNNDEIFLNVSGDNSNGRVLIHSGGRGKKWWGYASSYNGVGIVKAKIDVSNSCDLYVAINKTFTSVQVYTTFSPTISACENFEQAFTVPNNGGIFGNEIRFTEYYVASHTSPIGSVLNASKNVKTITGGSSATELTSLDIPAGTWILHGSVLVKDNTTDNMFNLGISTSIPTADSWYDYDKAGYYKGASWARLPVTTIVTPTATTTYKLWCRPGSTHNTDNYGYLHAVRIS